MRFNGKKRNTVSWLPTTTEDSPPKALIFISHGLHEHSLRYYSLAHALTANNFAVYSIDHHAHGLSEGEVGMIDDYNVLMNDFIAFTQVIQEKHPLLPSYIFCHSMGTLVAINAASSVPNLKAMVISSNALEPGTVYCYMLYYI